MKSCKSCLSFYCNLIDFFKLALKFDWLVYLIKLSHWLGERCSLKCRIVQSVKKSNQ